MLTIAIFTYKRLKSLNQCIASLQSNNISEILIFNDNENELLKHKNLEVNEKLIQYIKIFNPIDFGFKKREFRKPIYLNKAVDISKNEFILFSDDDGIFNKGAIDQHYEALKVYPFSAGSIIRSRIIKKVSKTILQGTNYAFRKKFYNSIGRYDENFTKSLGGGDVDFWYRIYHYILDNNLSAAFLPKAIQRVSSKSTRKKIFREMDPRDYTINKHKLIISGPMYKWFPEIRNKSQWMDIFK